MKTLRVTKQFKKDVNRLTKQRKEIQKLKVVIDTICKGETLDPKYRDHRLIGDYKKARECHIEPHWLLIYERFEDLIILRRSGSHAELFKS